MEMKFTATVFAVLFVATLGSANMAKKSEMANTKSTDTTTEPPSQEAVSACGGKSVGTSCSYTGPDALGASGTCTKPNRAALLACRDTHSGRTVR